MSDDLATAVDTVLDAGADRSSSPRHTVFSGVIDDLDRPDIDLRSAYAASPRAAPVRPSPWSRCRDRRA
jgi:hypothetical protein